MYEADSKQIIQINKDMKIQVNEKVKDKGDSPLLLKCKTHELIVLKTDTSDDDPTVFSGVVLQTEFPYHFVGEYSKGWGVNNFEVFDGNIVLSND